MKHRLIFLTGALALTLAGCGGSSTNTTTTNTASNSATTSPTIQREVDGAGPSGASGVSSPPPINTNKSGGPRTKEP